MVPPPQRLNPGVEKNKKPARDSLSLAGLLVLKGKVGAKFDDLE